MIDDCQETASVDSSRLIHHCSSSVSEERCLPASDTSKNGHNNIVIAVSHCIRGVDHQKGAACQILLEHSVYDLGGGGMPKFHYYNCSSFWQKKERKIIPPY